MMHRRTFLTTAVAAVVALTTTPSLAAITPHPQKIDLWDAKIATILQMADDYRFTPEEVQGLFGYTESRLLTRAELQVTLLGTIHNSKDLRDRVDNILTVHTWLRAKCGSCVVAQRHELDLIRPTGRYTTVGMRRSLGNLLRAGGESWGYFHLKTAADFCLAQSCA